jgi:hypothetical protein
MEHLAEEAIAGADKSTLQRAIKVHLHNCPDCQEHHRRRMEDMEAKIVSQEEYKTNG